jgi:hypothetical protein
MEKKKKEKIKFCFVIVSQRSYGKPDASSVLPYVSYCFSKLMECKEVWSERGKATL